ncbi:transporter associated domain-containing protein [Pararhodobacter sp.]|uniref:transporter associated domain-containing protein n=1 Tax=Pararhodobacter sp. TaxID=2127056 RepID=UPI002B003A73|nr:transporter associated domain-containing protein [Pararhodobacter sp.]
MTDSHTGTGPADTLDVSEDPDPSPDDSTQQRGLLGRLFDAFTPNEAEDPAERALNESMRQVLPGLANLRRLRVADVAVPKAEIVSISHDTTIDDLIAIFRESGFSRLPVYHETLDKPMGLLLLKDLVLNRAFDLRNGDLVIDELLRPLLFVPPSMPLVILLQKMQAGRMHMALVIDEYGGVDGLVTIEDLLEQVVGQIEDEHDTEDEHLWQAEAPGVWLIQARALLEDLHEALGIDLAEGIDDDEVDTLGGLIFVLLGRVPARGEVIALPAGHEIEVIEADPRRVKRLRLRLAGTGDSVSGD